MRQKLGRRWWARTATSSLFVLAQPLLFAQFSPPGQSSLTLSSGLAYAGSTVYLDLFVTVAPGSEPAGLQWTLSYPAGDVAFVGFAAGSALTGAGKSVCCNAGIASITCVAVGLNANPILTGVAAVVALTLAPATGSSRIGLSVDGTLAAMADGTSTPVSGVGGSITVLNWQPPVTGYFADVAPTDSYFAAANILYAKGISNGCSAQPLLFCPTSSLTRGQMAKSIIQAVLGGPPTSFSPVPYFVDVPSTHLFFTWIQKLFELGITRGCSVTPAKFCPDDPLPRGQIASLMGRARYGPTTTFAYPAVPYFIDVPATDMFFAAIQKMAQLGMTGCGGRLYCENDPVTRGEMAFFVVRGLLNQLLPVGAPLLTSANPSASFRGGPATPVVVTGANTHFAPGLTLYAGPGVAVLGVTVVDSQTILATLSASPSATPGPCSLIVMTGSEEAVLPNGLTLQ